ncbi:hypothetical protein EAO77_33950 [Streptomyces sp. t39]|nr:hypothetical protein EAO77_33950 [Streptomyces sp. t39]
MLGGLGGRQPQPGGEDPGRHIRQVPSRDVVARPGAAGGLPGGRRRSVRAAVGPGGTVCSSAHDHSPLRRP